MTRVDALERDGDERDMEESTPSGLRSTIDVSRYIFHALFLSADFFDILRMKSQLVIY